MPDPSLNMNPDKKSGSVPEIKRGHIPLDTPDKTIIIDPETDRPSTVGDWKEKIAKRLKEGKEDN